MKKTVLLFALLILYLNFFLNRVLSAQVSYVSEKGSCERKENFDHLNDPDYNLLNGKAYDSVTINYDIINQQVVLQHPGSISGRNLKVVLNTKLIDHFKSTEKRFERCRSPGKRSASGMLPMISW